MRPVFCDLFLGDDSDRTKEVRMWPIYSKEKHLVEFYHYKLETSQSFVERLAIISLIQMCHW